MLSGKAREKANMQGHGRRWNAMAVMARDILSAYAPIRPEWPTVLMPKFARIAKGKGHGTAQCTNKGKGKCTEPGTVKNKDGGKGYGKSGFGKGYGGTGYGKGAFGSKGKGKGVYGMDGQHWPGAD